MIACRGVGRRFGGFWALRGVTFEVGRGAAVAVLGPNGAGKTTLVRILTTELAPTEGAAEVAGLDVVKDAERLRRVIAAVPQEARPIDFLTPYEFVLSYLLLRGLPLREARRRTAEALRQFGLWEARGRELDALSGGMKRRTLVAAVFASEAEVVFLDEPTTGLDAYSRRVVWNAVAELKRRGATVVLTTHYAEEAAALADWVLVLKGGRAVDFAPPAKLVEKVPGRYVVEVYGGAELEGRAVAEVGGRRLYYVDAPAYVEGAVVRPKSLEDYILLNVGAAGGHEGD
ncbi:ABC transporter ATP-binding protein [Pyrobaculum neutrophilum]|uniref:ABC transporter related n=1 Tax=Pyrobaculum neutrophilum (strain DSM 2338 / JCM 9278 / NBRC 100436 / V24Sta) TaxID=444157 RepID=B1YDZ6_PYRNV|nr:ABC transporter ATP-binding protein [Pyrobaculum neutrophilum]ACB40009.1 ABC transporter related [Pyrobaculum neutrophilum V24Sta]